MRGSYDVRVGNARVQFSFTLRRNITVVRGMSATGKTTLVGLIAAYEESGPSSGIRLSCDKPCVVLRARSWARDLAALEESIVFIDEGSSFVRTKEFAHAMADTGCYFVFAMREDLPMLPYSVEEIYELSTVRRKRPELVRSYTRFKRMYGQNPTIAKPQKVIVEDSGSGFDFYRALCERRGIECVSARGKARVLGVLRSSDEDRIVVVADGAAFGPEMSLVLEAVNERQAGLFLPESFEWLVLQSGVVPDTDLPEVLAHPSDYVESRKYLSWEQFFTAELSRRTVDSYLRYAKGALPTPYLQGQVYAEIESAAMKRGFPAG